MNTSISSFESRVSPHNPFVQEFKQLASEGQVEKVVAMIDETTREYLLVDNMKTNFVLNHERFFAFHQEVLDFGLEKNGFADPLFKKAYEFFLKIYLVKSNFRFAPAIFRKIFKFVGTCAETPKCPPEMLSVIFSVLNLLSGYNFYLANSRYLMFSGNENSSLSIVFDNEKEFFKPFLSREFTYLVCFTTDFSSNPNVEEPAYLLRFSGESAEQETYGIFYRGDKLWFSFKAGANKLIEFVIFENAYNSLSKKWNSLVFSCDYDQKNKSSILSFRLNEAFYKKSIAFDALLSREGKLRLSVFANVSGYLSTLCYFNRVLADKEYKTLCAPVFSQGLTTSEAFEHFIKVFEEDFHKGSLQFLLTALFNDPGVSRREASLVEFIHQKPIGLSEDCIIVENNSNDFSFAVVGKKIYSSIFALFNFVSNSDDFKNLLKIATNFLSQDRVVNTLEGKLRSNLYRTFLATLICTGGGQRLACEQVETLASLLNAQNTKHRRAFLNKFLLSFHLLLHVLHSEETTKAFFNQIYKIITADANLLAEIDVAALLKACLIFLSRGGPSDFSKALQLARLAVKILAERPRTMLPADLTGILLFLNAPVEGQTQVFFYFLAAISLSLKSSNYKVGNKDLFVSCLSNFLVQAEYALPIEKTLKLLAKLEPEPEKLLVFLWRSKFAREHCLDSTRRIFLRYAKTGQTIQSSLSLTSFLLKRVFLNLNKYNIFSSEKMQLNRKGMFNLLFDVSIILEPANIEKILQCLLVALKKNSREFVACARKTNFLIWNTVLLFLFKDSESNVALFELANKLLTSYCLAYTQCESDVNFLGQLSELVEYYSNELSDRQVKFLTITNIFRELNSKDVIMASEETLNSFVIYTFQYFYANLRTDSSSSLYIPFLEVLVSYIHKNVNLNPSVNLALSMQKELATSLSPKLNSSFAFWGLSSSALKNMRMVRDTPLKYLTVLLIAVLEDLGAQSQEEVLETSYKCANGYFEKLLTFLENNRLKLKPEKVYAIEVSLYYLLKSIFKRKTAQVRTKEIKESLFYFSDGKVYPNSFSAKFLKTLGVQNELIIEKFFASMAAVQPSQSIFMEEYEDYDYNQEHDGFALKALGEINQALEETNILLCDMFFAEAEVEKLSPIKSSMFVKNNASLKLMINALYVEQLVKLQRLYNTYYKLYKREKGIHGNLLDENVRTKNYVEEFKISNFDYEERTAKSLKFKHNPIILRNLERPFLKRKPDWSWKKIEFPDVFKLAADMSIANLFFYRQQEYFPCDIVHQLMFVPAFALVSPAKLRLEVYINNQHNSNYSLIELKKYKFKPHKKLLYTYPLSEIKDVKPYKFLQSRTALLIILKDRRQLILNFKSAEHARQFELSIQPLEKSSAYKRKDSRILNDSRTITGKWLGNKFSNYKYLMKMNLSASRSFSDFSQYPVFPLLIRGFGKAMKVRDLSKPIGMVGDEKRARIFKARYKSTDNFSEHPSYHYGSHYSSPATVFNCLIRIKPYEKGCKAIQSGHFDLPDRLFFSIKFMVKNIMEEMSDVREMIPEMFYLPELFLNINNFDFGINQHKTRVHNVLLPDLFLDNPYRFVFQTRHLLESAETSLELGSWIDLVFGFKQQGDEAAQAHNLFFHLTYEDKVKDALSADAENRHAIETQIYHFGQTPFQIFDKPHPSKKNGREPTIASLESQVKYFVKVRDKDAPGVNPTYFMKELAAGGFIESASLRKILLLKQDSIEVWKCNVAMGSSNAKNPFEFLLIDDINIQKLRKQLLLNCHNPIYKKVVEVYGKNKIIYGGFYNGSILIFNFSSGKLLARHGFHYATVVHMSLDKENRLITCDTSGIIVISKLDTEANSLTPIQYVYDYYGLQILSIGFAQNMKDIFYVRTRTAVDLRSTCFIGENLANIRLLSSPSQKQVIQTVNGFKEVLVSFGYINCIVAYLYYQKKNYLFSFSFEGQIIGKYVSEKEAEPAFHKFFLVADEYFKDHALVCNKKGDILIFDLPFFEQGRRLSSGHNSSIGSAMLLNNNKMLLLVDEKGNIDICSVISV